MAVVQAGRIQSANLAEMLSHLKDLADIIKDPKSIEKAHEIARQQNSLTDAEQQKVDEARAAVTQHQELHIALTKSHEKLKIDQNDHVSNVALFNEKCAAKEAQLAAAEEIINNRNAILLENEKNHADNSQQLTIEKNAFARQDKINQDELVDHRNKLVKWEAELMEDKARIAAKENDLNE